MASAEGQSVSDLQAEAELRRTELAHTVTALRSKMTDTADGIRERISSESIKAEARDYVRDRTEALMDKAKDNPLQAAAIGLGIAYPIVGLIRSIPAPILMIGAGLFFLGSNSGQKIVTDASSKLAAAKDVTTAAASHLRDRAAAGLTTAQEQIASGMDVAAQHSASAGEALGRVKENISGLTEAAQTRFADLTDQASGAATRTADSVRDAASKARAVATDTVSRAGDLGSTAAAASRDARDKAGAAVADAVQNHPLVVGGLGLALGMVLAGALPKSDLEEQVLGEASTKAQRRAAKLVSDGVDIAKDLAASKAADLLDQAKREGLLPEDLSEAAEDIGGRVRKVAEVATAAALGTGQRSSGGVDRTATDQEERHG
jgi:hypothetical protein